MKPKDLLIHLEKGDRTEEMLEKAPAAGQLAVAAEQYYYGYQLGQMVYGQSFIATPNNNIGSRR